MSHESNRFTFVCLQYKTNKFQHQEKNFDFSLIFFSENSLYIMRAKIRLSPLENLESRISESPATYNWPCRNPRSVSAGASRSDAMRLPNRSGAPPEAGEVAWNTYLKRRVSNHDTHRGDALKESAVLPTMWYRKRELFPAAGPVVRPRMSGK